MDRQAFCNPVQSENSTISDSLSPTTLLNMLRIETPKFAIKIRGEVLAIRPWPNKENPIYLYGDIGDAHSCIEFKIRPTNKLQLCGQHIEILGALHTSQNYKHDGIKISIEGEMINEYKVEILPPNLLVHDIDRTQLSLKQFLNQYNFKELCVLSTRHGFSDLISKTNQVVHYGDVVFSVCNFDTVENIIRGIKEAATNQNIKGIAIIHDGINCWDNRKWDNSEVVLTLLDTGLHIYTALCETEKLLLADKHSDQTFLTPNIFAQQLANIVVENRQANSVLTKAQDIEVKFNNILASKFKLRRIITLLLVSNITLLTVLLFNSAVATN